MEGIDQFVKIAHHKNVCQDYAISGVLKEGDIVPFAIVADGCSSAKNTEIGAIDLVGAMEQYLYPGCSFDRSFMAACGRADAIRSIRGNDITSLYATMMAVILDDKSFKTAVAGDGFEIFRKRGTNQFDIFHTEFESNMPLYPIYFTSPSLSIYRCSSIVNSNNKIVKFISLDLDNDDPMVIKNLDIYKPNEFTVCIERCMSLKDYDMALLFSDGLTSFKDKCDQEVPLEQILRTFLSFRNIQGNFLQRRMSRAFNDVDKKGWKNFDDFSVAGISRD